MTETAAESPSALNKLKMTLDMIKFEHSIFALPFALTGALLAIREDRFATPGLALRLAWILVAMVAARSAAMAFNRLLDHEIDARNPRTANRHLPVGTLSRGFAWAFTLTSLGVFIGASAMLGPLCLKLSPVALAVVLGYSYTKRFTSLSHLVLGLALGIAPSAAWIAIRGSYDPRMLWLTAAVMLWTAGFDIIYACQDYEFDRRSGLHSLPARLGIGKALRVSRLFHILMVLCLVLLIDAFQLGWLAAVGVVGVAIVLAYEQTLVSARDLSKVNAAFFTMNGYVSLVFFAFWTADVFWR